MSAVFDQLTAAIVGRLGEIAAADVMKADGASTIALCRIDAGGAPMLESGTVRRDHLVLPDLQVFNWKHAPGCRFVEIKTYERAAENKRHECWVHGIPVRLFDHYVANESTTGVPVHLAINELSTGELRISDVPLSQLDRLPCQCRGGCRSCDPRLHTPSTRGIQEMQWYFDREDFSIIYKHSDKTIEHLRRAHRRLIGGHAMQRHGSAHSLTPFRDDSDPLPCDSCGARYDTKTPSIFMQMAPGRDGKPWWLCLSCWRTERPTHTEKRHGARRA